MGFPWALWLSSWHIKPAVSAAIVLCFLVSAVGIGFFHLSGPASRWVDEAPKHMTELRQRIQSFFPRMGGFSEAAAALNNLGATEKEKRDEQKKAPVVEVKTRRGSDSILNWTGTLLVGIGETIVLLYLLLVYGDLFMQKLVQVMPTWHDKKRAVEITREVQHTEPLARQRTAHQLIPADGKIGRRYSRSYRMLCSTPSGVLVPSIPTQPR
jgi:predicted PurR-regulated permease PerM